MRLSIAGESHCKADWYLAGCSRNSLGLINRLRAMTTLWVAKTASRGKHTRSIAVDHGVRVGVSDPGQSAWAADRGFSHMQKSWEPTVSLGPAPTGVVNPVSFKLPDAGSDGGGHR